jgi:hypothetical protein
LLTISNVSLAKSDSDDESNEDDVQSETNIQRRAKGGVA